MNGFLFCYGKRDINGALRDDMFLVFDADKGPPKRNLLALEKNRRVNNTKAGMTPKRPFAGILRFVRIKE